MKMKDEDDASPLQTKKVYELFPSLFCRFSLLTDNTYTSHTITIFLRRRPSITSPTPTIRPWQEDSIQFK
jgi:hypothetical protein